MFMVYYYFSVSREDNFISEIWQISVIVYFKQVQRDNQNIPFDLTNYWELVPPTSNNTWKRLYFISGDSLFAYGSRKTGIWYLFSGNWKIDLTHLGV